jgi:hypothetical protein
MYVESNNDERFFLDLLASYDLAFREGCILNKDKEFKYLEEKMREIHNSKIQI